MPRLLGHITVECTGCGHRSTIERGDFEDRTDADLTFDTVGQIYSRLVCRHCRGRAINVHDDAGRLLINSSNVTRCRLCNDPILCCRGSTRCGGRHSAANARMPPQFHRRRLLIRSLHVIRQGARGAGARPWFERTRTAAVISLAVPAFRDVDGPRPSRAARHDCAGALSVRGRFPGSISEQADLARAAQ